MMDNKPTLRNLFECVEEVYDQCQLLVRDAIKELRKETDTYYTHHRAWDYVNRPNEHFLDHESSSTRRVWLTYRPEGSPSVGVVFRLEFFHHNRRVIPSLLYGCGLVGSGSLDEKTRWTTYNATQEAEEGKDSVTVIVDGPLTTVRVKDISKDNYFTEAVFTKVPLESIQDLEGLRRIVVLPLASLVRGDRAEAASLLSLVETIPWPGQRVVEDDDAETDEDERA